MCRIHINFIFYYTALILCFSCRKISLFHRIYFELNNNILQLSLDCPFWYFLSTGSELGLHLVSQTQHVTCERGIRKSYVFFFKESRNLLGTDKWRFLIIDGTLVKFLFVHVVSIPSWVFLCVIIPTPFELTTANVWMLLNL